MKEEIEARGELDQEDAVDYIEKNFDGEHTYFNEGGGVSISRRVLREFKKLTDNTVVWERSDRYWRLRKEYDGPGRLVE